MDIKGIKKIQCVLKDKIGYLQKDIQLKRLEKYEDIINSVLASYRRKSSDETMMVKGTRKFDATTTNRETHQVDVGGIVQIAAKQIGLNDRIAKIIAENHDIGHTFLGHSGEWWISNRLEEDGLGAFCHNALGARDLIYTYDIYQEIIDKIKLFNPKISNRELPKIKDSLWLIIDGSLGHNGEMSDSEIVPNVGKTQADFEEELVKCHTEPGFDKIIIPATPEACLMRLADKISYTASDMVDGLKEGFIKGLNNEYREQLEKLGITQEEIEGYLKSGNYDTLGKRIKDIFTKDLIENSSKKKIAMSQEKAKIMHHLRRINNRQIVDFVLMEEDFPIYINGINTLIDTYRDIILQGNMEEYENTPYMPFTKYVSNMSQKDYEYTKKLVEKATRQSVAEEQAMARKMVKKQGKFVPTGIEKKDTRIQIYASYYTNKFNELAGQPEFRARAIEYTNEQINQDIENVMKNILQGKSSEIIINMQERMATAIGAKYLSTLSDREFSDLLVDTGLAAPEQAQSLHRKYKDIDLKKEARLDSNWMQISAQQDEDLGEK